MKAMEEMSRETRELLKAVVENAAIGKQTLCKLIKRSDDPVMRNTLARQFAEYHAICTEADQMLGDAKSGARIPRAPIFASLAVNLGMDATSTHMAEMVVQGSVMGMIDIKRQLRELPNAHPAVVDLAKRLLATEQSNQQEILEYV